MGNLKWADVAHCYSQSETLVYVDHEGGLDGGPVTRVSPKGEDLSLYTDGRRGDGWIIKPILRHLEDLTDTECFELMVFERVHFSPAYTHKDGDRVLWTKDSIQRSEMYPHSLFWVIRGKPMSWGFSPMSMSPDAFFHLISRGFDVFGLIESGEATRRESNG